MSYLGKKFKGFIKKAVILPVWLMLIAISTAVCAASPCNTVKAYAASAQITVSCEQQDIRVGDMVIIYLTISSVNNIGDFEGYLVYDEEYLEFVSAVSCITGGGGQLRISDMGSDYDTQRRYIVYFKALKATDGETNVSIYRPMIECHDDGSTMSYSDSSASLKIGALMTSSSNDYLSSLRVATGTIVPEFDKNTLEYKVSVPYESRNLFIEALAEDSKSKVVKYGADDLVVGANTVKIVVMSEAGTQRTYVLNVTRLEEKKTNTGTSGSGTTGNTGNSGNTGNTGDSTPAGGNTGVSGSTGASENTGTTGNTGNTGTAGNSENTGNTGSTENKGNAGNEVNIVEGAVEGIWAYEKDKLFFMSSYVTFQIADIPSNITSPVGYEATYVYINGIAVKAYAKRGGTADDFVLLYLTNTQGTTGWYAYDRLEQTIQRVRDENVVIQQVTSGDELAARATIENYKKTNNMLVLVLALACGLIAMLLVLNIWQFLQKRTVRHDELDI